MLLGFLGLVLRAGAMVLPIAATTLAAAGTAAAGGAVTIEVFWRADCPPCRRELPILPRIAARHPDVAVVLVVLQDDGTPARAFAADPQPNLAIRRFEGNQARLLAGYGNGLLGLPFAVARDATGAVCATHYGVLGTDLADAWAASC